MSHLFGNYSRVVTITGGYTPVFPGGKPIQSVMYNNPFSVVTVITGSGPFSDGSDVNDTGEDATSEQKYQVYVPANSSFADHEPFFPRSTVYLAATSGTKVAYRYGAGKGDDLTEVF